MKVKRTVLVTTEVEVEFDDSLLPDDEWRESFYQIHTLEQLAEHLGYNYVVNNAVLRQLDGFADRNKDQCTYKIVGRDAESQQEIES